MILAFYRISYGTVKNLLKIGGTIKRTVRRKRLVSKLIFKDYWIRVGERVACWPADATIKLKTVSSSGSGSLLLSIQSDSAIPSSAFAKYGSFERVYCELSASSQFVTLVRPNDLLCAKRLSLSIMPDLAFKTDLFLISRDYCMARCDQASSDSEMN